jgi:hypothetical protein
MSTDPLEASARIKAQLEDILAMLDELDMIVVAAWVSQAIATMPTVEDG